MGCRNLVNFILEPIYCGTSIKASLLLELGPGLQQAFVGGRHNSHMQLPKITIGLKLLKAK
jgi:hypothetical protein